VTVVLISRVVNLKSINKVVSLMMPVKKGTFTRKQERALSGKPF